MVDLVLEDARQPVVGFEPVLLAEAILRLEQDVGAAVDIGGDAGDAQASFLTDLAALLLDDFGLISS
jgi:hypothetical protein